MARKRSRDEQREPDPALAAPEAPPPPGPVEGGLFLAALAGYAATLARGPEWGDSTELTLVADSFAIPHPTGYPLYVMLGWLLCRLPLSALPLRVGLLSAIPMAVAVVLAYRLALRMCGSRTAAATAALGFAFWRQVWEEASSPEVYGLHLALATAILVALARLLESPSPRRLLALAFAGGLGFAHHMQTVFLVPGAVGAVLLIPQGRALLADPRQLARTLAMGCLPLALYGVLMVRAHQEPWVDQAGAGTPAGLIAHMTGRQFAYRMFGESSAVQIVREMGRLHKEVLQQAAPSWPLALPALWLAMAGAAAMIRGRGYAGGTRSSRELSVALVISATTCVVYTLNYSIPDKSSYYFTLHLVTALALSIGLAWVERGLAGRHPVIFRALVVLLVAVPLTTNHAAVDRSGDASLADYTADLAKLAPPRSLLVTDDLTLWWGLVYRQRALGLDRDRSYLCTYPMRLRWYLPFLRRQYPDLLIPAGLEEELERELARIEEQQDPTGQTSQALVQELTAKLIESNLGRRDVLLVIHQTPDDLASWGPFALQSAGLAFRVAREPQPPVFYPTDYAPPERHRVGEVHGADQVRVARRYATSLNRLGILHIKAGQFADAEKAFLRALEYDPRYAQVLTNMGVLYAQHMNRQHDAYLIYRRFMEVAADDKQAPAVAAWLGDYQSRLVRH